MLQYEKVPCILEKIKKVTKINYSNITKKINMAMKIKFNYQATQTLKKKRKGKNKILHKACFSLWLVTDQGSDQWSDQ